MLPLRESEKKGTCKMAKKEEAFDLEAAFKKLEETTRILEREEISLEESFAEYQKGMELLKQCNAAIDKVEKKVLVLNEDGETEEF